MQQRRKDITLFFLAAQVILCISLCHKGPEKVRSERWFNITGWKVSDHTTSPVFHRQANKVKYLSCFEEAVPAAPNYLGRYRSYLLPNETGNFTFFTFCDDTCQLFLSSGINPRNKRLIIHQTKNVGQAPKNCCRNGQLESFQRSVSPRYLKENKAYYIELLIKNGQGGGRVSVGMRTPSGEIKLPISEENLLKSITKEYIPDEYCAKAGDSRYPDYIVDCNEFPDSVKVILCISLCHKGTGKVRSERWFNITGWKVSDHTTSPVFHRQANKVKYLSCFEEAVPAAPNYLGRYRSYLLPNETGNFTFFTFCDDTCQLFLSSGINPRNKRLIIHQTRHLSQAPQNCCRTEELKSFQKSVPRYLKENKAYYIELLIKNGQGNGRVSVGMRTPSGETKLPISEENLLKNIAKEYIPDKYCAEAGDSRYPDYIVDCNEFPDSVKVDKAIVILKELQARVENKMNPSPDFLLQIMETASKRTSALLESLNDSFVEENVNRSNEGFEIAREVEKLGESIASRIPNASETIAVNYSSIYMEASKREDRFVFVAKSSKTRERGLQDSITITLGNTSQKMAYFFSAFYKNLEKAIQHNVRHVHGENPSSKPKRYFLNSKIISGAVSRPSNESFQGEVAIKLRHTKYRSLEKMTMQCVFWRYSNRSNDSTGVWSSEGCYKDAHLSNDQATVCRCNHLTHFAILMQVTDDPEVIVLGKSHRKALEIITYVGCGLSLLGEVLTILTLTFLKLTRSETSMIHLNLVVALATAQIIFLTGIEATQNKAACKIVAVLLHYFNLVSFTWMLTEGIWLYVMIVRVFENGHSRIKKYCACAWGIPFVFVVITLSASFDGYGTETSCWLSVQKGTIWSFVVPVLLIAVANSIILGMVMREILRLNEPTTKENLKYQSVRSGVQSAIVLLPLLGITWIFGILTFNDETVAFQYLFALFNSLQGFFIFLFHCLLNSEVRRVFHSKKKIWSESRDMLQTNSLSPQNYNDISKETVSSRSMRPGSGGSTASNLTQKPCT